MPDLVAESTINVHFQMCQKCAKRYTIYINSENRLKKWHISQCVKNVPKMCHEMCQKCAKR